MFVLPPAESFDVSGAFKLAGDILRELEKAAFFDRKYPRGQHQEREAQLKRNRKMLEGQLRERDSDAPNKIKEVLKWLDNWCEENESDYLAPYEDDGSADALKEHIPASWQRAAPEALKSVSLKKVCERQEATNDWRNTTELAIGKQVKVLAKEDAKVGTLDHQERAAKKWSVKFEDGTSESFEEDALLRSDATKEGIERLSSLHGNPDWDTYDLPKEVPGPEAVESLRDELLERKKSFRELHVSDMKKLEDFAERVKKECDSHDREVFLAIVEEHRTKLNAVNTKIQKSLDPSMTLESLGEMLFGTDFERPDKDDTFNDLIELEKAKLLWDRERQSGKSGKALHRAVDKHIGLEFLRELETLSNLGGTYVDHSTGISLLPDKARNVVSALKDRLEGVQAQKKACSAKNADHLRALVDMRREFALLWEKLIDFGRRYDNLAIEREVLKFRLGEIWLEESKAKASLQRAEDLTEEVVTGSDKAVTSIDQKTHLVRDTFRTVAANGVKEMSFFLTDLATALHTTKELQGNRDVFLEDATKTLQEQHTMLEGELLVEQERLKQVENSMSTGKCPTINGQIEEKKAELERCAKDLEGNKEMGAAADALLEEMEQAAKRTEHLPNGDRLRPKILDAQRKARSLVEECWSAFGPKYWNYRPTDGDSTALVLQSQELKELKQLYAEALQKIGQMSEDIETNAQNMEKVAAMAASQAKSGALMTREMDPEDLQAKIRENIMRELGQQMEDYKGQIKRESKAEIEKHMEEHNQKLEEVTRQRDEALKLVAAASLSQSQTQSQAQSQSQSATATAGPSSPTGRSSRDEAGSESGFTILNMSGSAAA